LSLAGVIALSLPDQPHMEMTGSRLLDHVADMLADRRTPPTPAQLRFLSARMSEALSDVRRIAESRGARLPVPPCDEPDQDQKCVAIPNTRRN
jgi:hypothetical protein